MTAPIRTLIPPGGFSNLVGHHLAALDVGLDHIKSAARDAEQPGDVLAAIGALECAWLHEAVGKVPSPPPPEGDADVEAWLGWLDALRTVSLMVLRPLPDRDLERLIDVGDEEGPMTLRRLLAELLFREGRLCGRLDS